MAAALITARTVSYTHLDVYKRQIHDTQSALVLEDLIGKFLLNSVNKDEAKK